MPALANKERHRILAGALCLLVLGQACSSEMNARTPAKDLGPVDLGPKRAPDPSDDPADYTVDTSVDYQIQVSDPAWLFPSETIASALTAGGAAPLEPSNNNVAIHIFDGRLFVASRNSVSHFAGTGTRMFLFSTPFSGDLPTADTHWTLEQTIALGSDVREPHFLTWEGSLLFHHFQGGMAPTSFAPVAMWRMKRLPPVTPGGPSIWSPAETFGEPKEVPWDIKVRGGRALMTSYIGNHYETGESKIDVFFKTTSDGLGWSALDPAHPIVYTGGVSETAFELEENGDLWAVMRNEDGDQTGWGSHVCKAQAGALSIWTCTEKSNPERYDSPKMFRHGNEIYLVARRDIGGPFDEMNPSLPFDQQKIIYNADYWMRPKRTSLYRIDKATMSVVHLLDFPSAGDTAFPSIRRIDAHRFLIANYTSRVDDPDRSWLNGQTSPEGTKIYLVMLTFVKK